MAAERPGLGGRRSKRRGVRRRGFQRRGGNRRKLPGGFVDGVQSRRALGGGLGAAGVPGTERVGRVRDDAARRSASDAGVRLAADKIGSARVHRRLSVDASCVCARRTKAEGSSFPRFLGRIFLARRGLGRRAAARAARRFGCSAAHPRRGRGARGGVVRRHADGRGASASRRPGCAAERKNLL